jgi:3-oxoacyl-[acyl-carrier-protein] synthase II
MIRSGEADIVLAGGAESPVVRAVVVGFERLQALAHASDPRRASRPFDTDRTGFVIAEGSAVIVLESAEHAMARGAQVYARFVGFGRSGDAHHSTAPDPHGRGAAVAMRSALRNARIAAADVGFVNAHGTGTRLNDVAEAAALHKVLGELTSTTPVTDQRCHRPFPRRFGRR